MANKNLDTPSFVPRLPMSALREKEHLQKRLFEYDKEEEKQLRKIKQNQECLMKDLGGSGLDQQNANLLTKQKKLMELRRARFTAPAFTTMKRENVRQLSEPSTEDDIDVKFQDLLLLTSGKTRPISALKIRPMSTGSSPQFSSPLSPREMASRKESEDGIALVNRAGSKQGKISLNPPPLQLNSSAQQNLRLHADERLCKSSSVETARTEADLAIVDIEQDVENEWSSGDKEDQKEFWKDLMRRGTPDSGSSATQSVTIQEGRKGSARKSQDAGVSRRKDENKRRRKIGIQHCVKEIAPAFKETVHSNEGSSTLFIDVPRESRSLVSTMSFGEEQRLPTAAKPDDSNNGSSVNNAMQTGRASSAVQINKSNAGKTSLSGTERNPSTSRLGVDDAAGFRVHGNASADINTPRLMRKMSRNQRTLVRCSSELDLVGKKDSGSHLDASDVNGDSPTKSSVTKAVAEQNFRRLNFLSLATNPSFSGSEKSKKNSASAKMQPERKLSRARLDELQKPTESSATKHRSISVSGAHPTLHGSPPEISRRGSPSGLRNFRKISSPVVAANIISEKRRRWSSVIKPTSPQANEDKSLSEMMADVRDCRYLRRSVTSSSTESD